MRIIVTTHPFTEDDEFLKNNDTVYNAKRRKLTGEELRELLATHDPDVIIAGTETYNSEILDLCPNLKMISRVGIGMDSVDVSECARRNIHVSNTPDAPTRAVAEMTIGQMVMLARRMDLVNRDVRTAQWNRYIGKEIGSCTVGIIGYGRIGRMVAQMIRRAFGCEILVTDISAVRRICADYDGFIISDKERILRACDIVSIHIPGENNKNFIDAGDLEQMKPDAVLINNSRGGIVDEDALYEWLVKNENFTCALDVFEEEPYFGRLSYLPNLFATPHLGSCTKTSRAAMEAESISNVKKFFSK
jgi:D-3-phosphoglycerate dehydrogenase